MITFQIRFRESDFGGKLLYLLFMFLKYAVSRFD